MLPEIQQLVSMVDSEASLPVYTFLNDYLEKVDSSLDVQVCMLLYPDAKKAGILLLKNGKFTIGKLNSSYLS
jgi:hypothetical protein